jgi:Na+-translocating ferredoxin:NAD+ oxidoreductase subunit B
MSHEEIYGQLINWLRRTWWGLPEAAELLPTVQASYTPEEALFLTGLPFSPKPLEDLAQAKGLSAGALAAGLDAMARRGLVFRVERGGTVRYGLNDTFFVWLRTAFWPGRDDDRSRNLAPRVNAYFPVFFDQYRGVEHRGLRALPVAEVVSHEGLKQAVPYEDVAKVLESQDYFCVTICPCRHRKNLDPAAPNCKHTTENCLHFGGLARYIVENGLGREITREDARRILGEAADEGLVHGVSNWQEGVDTICNCCKCCCMWFEGFHVLKHARSMDVSNYIVRADPSTCKACGLCVKRCPMEALTLEASPLAENKKGLAAALKEDLCIGCGVCAHKCPTKSLLLVRREVTTDPPRDPRDYANRYMQDRQRLAGPAA